MTRVDAWKRGSAVPACVLALVGTTATVWPAQARAETTQDAAQARTLFDEARRLMADGDYPAACTKLEASNRVAPGVGTRFNLAECREKQGKLATAWATFLDVAAETKLLGDRRREGVARRRASELEPRLVRLILRSAASPGLELQLDGRSIELAALDTPVPIDPGDHILRARASGKLEYEQSIHVEGEGRSITIEVPPLADAPKPAVEQSKPPLRASNAPEEAQRSSRAPLLYGAAAVGAVGLAFGTYFGVRTLSARNELSHICSSGVGCQQADVDRYQDVRSEAIRARALSVGGFAVGGVAISALVLLLVRSEWREPAEEKALVVTSNAALGRIDVGVRGAW